MRGDGQRHAQFVLGERRRTRPAPRLPKPGSARSRAGRGESPRRPRCSAPRTRSSAPRSRAAIPPDQAPVPRVRRGWDACNRQVHEVCRPMAACSKRIEMQLVTQTAAHAFRPRGNLRCRVLRLIPPTPILRCMTLLELHMTPLALSINGMSCGHCLNAVRRALSDTPGRDRRVGAHRSRRRAVRSCHHHARPDRLRRHRCRLRSRPCRIDTTTSRLHVLTSSRPHVQPAQRAAPGRDRHDLRRLQQPGAARARAHRRRQQCQRQPHDQHRRRRLRPGVHRAAVSSSPPSRRPATARAMPAASHEHHHPATTITRREIKPWVPLALFAVAMVLSMQLHGAQCIASGAGSCWP